MINLTKTIKLIDLLVKIANGEEVPKRIKWEDTIYVYSKYDKDYLEFPISVDEYKGLFNMKDSILTQYLNDEAEIIEDKPKEERNINVCGTLFTKSEYEELAKSKDKKIEKIKMVVCDSDLIDRNHFVIEYLGELKYKINEIIDKINGRSEE